MSEVKPKRKDFWVWVVLAAIFFILIWPVAYFGGEWIAYWGTWLVSVIFGLVITYLRTKHFWEE